MTTLVRYDPFREVLRLRDAMNQLFEQSFVRPISGISSTVALGVPMDVFETEQGYQVKVLLPGVNPDDIDLSAQQNTLTIKGRFSSSIKPQKQGNWLIQEIEVGNFERSITFPMPIDADKIDTSYEQGVLSISVPIAETSRPKKISITGSQPKQVTVEAGAR